MLPGSLLAINVELIVRLLLRTILKRERSRSRDDEEHTLRTRFNRFVAVLYGPIKNAVLDQNSRRGGDATRRDEAADGAAGGSADGLVQP